MRSEISGNQGYSLMNASKERLLKYSQERGREVTPKPSNKFFTRNQRRLCNAREWLPPFTVDRGRSHFFFLAGGTDGNEGAFLSKMFLPGFAILGRAIKERGSGLIPGGVWGFGVQTLQRVMDSGGSVLTEGSLAGLSHQIPRESSEPLFQIGRSK